MKLLWKNKKRLIESEINWIKQAIITVFKLEELPVQGELSISILNDEEIREINRVHRGIDKSTDVLSFPQYTNIQEAKEAPFLVLGDIVLNIDQMKRQAEEFGHSNEREITYLTIHSLYHLLGFDHEDENSKKIMRAKEESALERMTQ